MSNERRWRGMIFILFAAVLWSTGGVFIKSITLDAFQLSMWRSLFAAASIVLLVRPKKIPLDVLTLSASVAYAATLIFFVMATKATTAANAILLQYTAPIYILFLAHFWLGEFITRGQLLAVAIALIGIALFFFDKLSPEGVLGNTYALISGAAFGAMTVQLRKKKHQEPIDAILLGNFWIVIICAAVCALPENNALNWSSAFSISWNDAIQVGFLGIFQIAIPYILFAKGIKEIRALDASLLGMIEPVLNPIWVLLIIGEIPSGFTFIGGGIILFGVLIQNILASRQIEKKPVSEVIS
jgi:drug/metabolite transporter, DME family